MCFMQISALSAFLPLVAELECIVSIIQIGNDGSNIAIPKLPMVMDAAIKIGLVSTVFGLDLCLASFFRRSKVSFDIGY